MATKSVRIETNKAGIIALLQSAEVQNDLAARAGRIASAAGEGFEATSTSNRDRAVAFVSTTDYDSRKAEAEDRALTRAIDAGR